MWGIGPRDLNSNYAYKHFERLVQSTKITFDRAPANNCPPQMCSAGEVCPWKEEVIDARNRNATFVAKIGQAGGTRGYFGITGTYIPLNSATCMHDYLIVPLEMLNKDMDTCMYSVYCVCCELLCTWSAQRVCGCTHPHNVIYV